MTYPAHVSMWSMTDTEEILTNTSLDSRDLITAHSKSFSFIARASSFVKRVASCWETAAASLAAAASSLLTCRMAQSLGSATYIFLMRALCSRSNLAFVSEIIISWCSSESEDKLMISSSITGDITFILLFLFGGFSSSEMIIISSAERFMV